MKPHTKDSDCTLDDRDTCTVCGVYHGDPCEFCGQRGFHMENCPGPKLEEEKLWGGTEPEPEDHSDDPCPCGDPECSRPFGHPEEA